VFVHVKKDKLDVRTKMCIFIRYIKGVMGYNLWRLESEKVGCFVSWDITFDETLNDDDAQRYRERERKSSRWDETLWWL